MSSMPFCLEGKGKSFLFIISPFLSSVPKIQSIPQFFTGSFAVDFGDHLRSRDHLRSGITSGTVQVFIRRKDWLKSRAF